MATINVSLPGDMVDFVESEVSSGGYASSSEVVREALRLLRHEKAQEAEKLAVLRREIRLGMDAVEAGKFSDKSVGEILEEVIREASAK